MLCVNTYPAAYIKTCRTKFDSHVNAFRKVKASLSEAELQDFEPHYFTNLLIALDAHFTHRARAIEKKTAIL
jgi:hypothetical protein